MPLGVIALLSAAALFYMGYNSHQTYDNLDKFADKPELYLHDGHFDADKFKQDMKKGTWLFGFAINYLSDAIAQVRT